MTRRTMSWALALALACACSAPPPAPATEPDPLPAAQAPTPAIAPRPAEGNPAAAPELRTRLPNGLAVAIGGATGLTHGTADLQLMLLAGTNDGAPGLCELAGEALLESADPSAGRPSLRQGIAALGGTLQLDVGPTTTWITVRCPAASWRAALVGLQRALQAPPMSRRQLERLRDALVRQRSADLLAAPAREVARAFMLDSGSTALHLAALLDRDASEVALYQARVYRPETAALAIRIPEPKTEDGVHLVATIGQWRNEGSPTGVVRQQRGLRSGLYWSPGAAPGRCRATLLLPLPEAERVDAAELLVMHACLTMDGTGGRLEHLQRERGLGHVRWRAEVVQFGEAAAMALVADATAAEAAGLWAAVEAARRSLQEVAPTRSEIELACRRAALTTTLIANGAAARLREHTLRSILGRKVRTADRLLALAQPGAFDAARAAAAHVALPIAMIVVGGEIPADAPAVRFDLLPPGALLRLEGGDAEPAAAPTPWLDRAVEALGGATTLTRLRGFEAVSELRTADAPVVEERLLWQQNGLVERTRTVLGGTVTTTVRGATWTERAGDREIPLSAREATLLQREGGRHPLALLAAHARGELKFRPVAQRTVGDRDLMILEAIGDRFERLRLHVDTVSSLVRVVETWETAADGTVVHLQDAWSDYRSAGGLRVPFRRVTEQDDGQNRVEAVVRSFTPLLPAQ